MRHLAMTGGLLLLAAPLQAQAAITFITDASVTPERLAGLQAAANELQQVIGFQQDIKVNVTFTNLSCTTNSAVLGSAGPQTAYSNFAGAPQTNVWYVSAQAANYGIAGAMDDAWHINAQFNARLGNTGCLTGHTWYYGADHNPGSGQVDFVSTAVHEFMHGLGFISFIGSSGALNGGFIDNYSTFLFDNSTGKSWKNMTDAERAASIINNGNLVWNGSKTTSMVSLLQAGVTNGRTRMYAPTTYASGSSGGHFDTVLLYDNNAHEVMEPIAMTPENRVLAATVFCDMGWDLLQDTDADGTNDCDDSDPLVAPVPDTDGDGYLDNVDAFPSNPAEWLDTDSDGTGNNADHDDDGDGVPDVVDTEPLNPAVKTEIVLPLNSGYGGATLNESTSVQ